MLSPPIAKAPVKLIISINWRIPIRKRNKGRKQAMKPERFLERPKSYQKTFLRVNPIVRKEVKQAIIPKRKPTFITLSPRAMANPEMAFSEV